MSKRKNKSFVRAATIFGVSAAAAAVIFVMGKGDNSSDGFEAIEEDILMPSITESVTEENIQSEAETEQTVTVTVTEKTEEEISAETEVTEEAVETELSVDETAVETTAKSRTVITSRERVAFAGSKVYIDMGNVLQTPELPVGCEITALTILLNYWGFDAEKTDMAKNYLPISSGRYEYKDGKTYKDSFFDFFIGDPFSRGYGCFSNAIVKAADKYIADMGGGYTVINLSGCDPDTLYDYVSRDIPVLVWATDGMIEPEYYETWYDIDTGEQLDWYLNEHCAVLAGFDIDGGYVTLNDPMKGIIDYNIDKFETRFKQMHSQAVVIIPDDSYEETAAETVPPETEEEITETETETAAESIVSDETEAPETETDKSGIDPETENEFSDEGFTGWEDDGAAELDEDGELVE